MVTLHVVTGDGTFNSQAVEQYVNSEGVVDAGVDYTVVAIMGPQSSGKSTLLNTLFGTQFEEMNALSGRQQTTKGIWLAHAPKIVSPPTLVMDLEGSDGRERGEDDTSFERQSALFALATADVVLVNMWAKDVGRETGAGKPLLKTIFQVNLKLFQPAPNRRRTVLLFVFRDRTKTPLELLTQTWEQDLVRMWESITKPSQYEQSSFTDFFEVQYAALSNYEDKPEDFMAETVLLRRRFLADEPDSFLRPSEEKLPGHALALSMEKVWEVVHEHKDLNLPAHRVMVANIRCQEIMRDQLDAFRLDQAWRALADEAEQDLVPGFGPRVGQLMDSCMTGYDEEARYFETRVSQVKADELQEALDALVLPVFESQLAILRELCLTIFKQQLETKVPGETFIMRAESYTAEALEQFENQVADIIIPDKDWNTAAARNHLERDITTHTNALRMKQVSTALAAAEASAVREVTAASTSLLESPPTDLWPRLGSLLSKAVQKAETHLDAALDGYGLGGDQMHDLHEQLASAARMQLVSHMHEAANTALTRLKDRFNDVFQRDEKGMPRTWQPNVDIPAVTAKARRGAAKLLSQLCYVRLAEPSTKERVIEAAVVGLADKPFTATSNALSSDSDRLTGAGPVFDLLAATEWPGVCSDDVLLTPAQVRNVWRAFTSDTILAVQQAMATQEANRAAKNRMPPLWAIAAMIVLGFNEFLAVLYNPLYLVLLVLLLLFGRTVYQELDVEAEMQRGVLPGAISLSAKFVPALKKVTGQVLVSGKQLLQDGSAVSQHDAPDQDSTFGGKHRSGLGDKNAAAQHLRPRRREEIQLSELSTTAFEHGSSRKDD